MQAYPGCEVYVAEEDHQICGTFVIYFLPNMTRSGRMAAVLENIVVDAEYRSKGIGRSMLEFARQKAVEQNCYKLSLTSNLKRTNAHAFYEHCGMQRHGYSFRYIL
jgi:GNAT superfamily N-acetyltransferase